MPNEDDDGLPPLGEDTDKFLSEVKKGKARNFLLVCKGTQVKYLAVRKKPIKKSELTEAKKNGYKGDGYFGVVNGSGMDLVFNLSFSDGYTSAPVKDKALKDFLEEKADFKCKPVIAVMAVLPEIPFDEDDLKVPQIARFDQLAKEIQKHVSNYPDARGELIGGIQEIRLLLLDGDMNLAEPALVQLETRWAQLKESIPLPPSPPPPPSSTPSPPSSPSPTTPPQAQTAPPAPKPPVDEALRKRLLDALSKLTPQLKQIIEKDAARKTELLTPVARIKEQITQGQLDEAKAALITLGQLIKTVLGSQSAAPTTTTPPADSMKIFMDRLSVVKAQFTQAKSGTPAAQELAGTLVDSIKQSAALAQQGQFGKAMQLLDDIERQLKEVGVAAETSDAALPEALEFARLLASIEDRYLEVLKMNPDNAGTLRAVMDFANGKAESSDYKSAIASLAKLDQLLAETERQLLDEACDLLLEGDDETRGVVKERKALLRWDIVRGAAFEKIRTVQSAVAAEFPDASVERLEDVFGEVDDSLHTALIDCINVEDEADRPYYNSCAKTALDLLRGRISQSRMIEGIDRNPFYKTTLKKDLLSALSEVESILG